MCLAASTVTSFWPIASKEMYWG